MICELYLQKVVFYFKLVSDTLKMGFPDGAVMVNLATSAGGLSSILESGKSPGGGMAIHSDILAWESSWTEEPGRLQSTRPQKSQT